jgi:hypothetical protein
VAEVEHRWNHRLSKSIVSHGEVVWLMIVQFSSDCNDWTMTMKLPVNEMSSFVEQLEASVRPYHRVIDECQRRLRSLLSD